ncbi:MAG TPA: hypothetical protein VHO70_19695, partial [Chitinispirillaceae bacterium]|nr:hypothetical protein [Chitinispirillaceae bacterium]
EEAESTYTSCTKEAEEIQEILSFKRQQVELGTLLEIQAKNRARANIREDIDTTMRAIRTIELEIETLQNKKKAFAKSDRRKTILREYHETMRSFLFGVDVHTLDQNDCHRIDTFINEMGSDLPRSYLAYYYAILSIIKKHGSAVYSPIVIDAPNQQGQDKTSMSRILNFIRDNQPGGTQMILGTEDLWGVKMPGKQIVLDEKYSLLSRCEYENVLNVMKPYLDQSLMVVENG